MGILEKLPIGIENFEEIRTQGFYYVDKTGLLVELLNNWAKVNLFTRPRRFGKSLNMSMMKSFFEIDGRKELFQGLKIAKEKELCRKYMGQFPVISLTLKGISGRNYEEARAMLCSVIGNEALRFQFLFDSKQLSEKEKALYEQLTTVDRNHEGNFVMSDAALVNGLLTLSRLLQKHYGQRVILLIDEYDVPLDKAYQFGYYENMVNLMRNLFNQALKTNDSLYFAVLTGCLRISKESIFTGLNNMKVLSIAEVQYDEYFGFIDEEVQEILKYYHRLDVYPTVKDWYDGYRFGKVHVYCPWDVICYCDTLRGDPDAGPRDYWSNTSSNDIIKRFLKKAKAATKGDLEELLAGGSVKKTIRQELTYKDLESSIENLWSMLFTTGYLTQRRTEGDTMELVIPNKEIRKIFTTQIMA